MRFSAGSRVIGVLAMLSTLSTPPVLAFGPNVYVEQDVAFSGGFEFEGTTEIHQMNISFGSTSSQVLDCVFTAALEDLVIAQFNITPSKQSIVQLNFPPFVATEGDFLTFSFQAGNQTCPFTVDVRLYVNERFRGFNLPPGPGGFGSLPRPWR
jgi:hypothetical protein